MKFTTTLEADDTDVQQAKKFAISTFYSGSFDAKNGDGSLKDHFYETFFGKLSEVAFSRFLDEKFGLDSCVNFIDYEDKSVDDGGADLLSIEGEEPNPFDVKKAKTYTAYQMVRDLVYDDHDMGDPFIQVIVPHPRDRPDIARWEQDDKEKAEARLDEYVESVMPRELTVTGVFYHDDLVNIHPKGSAVMDPSGTREVIPSLDRTMYSMMKNDVHSSKDDFIEAVERIVPDGVDVSFNEKSFSFDGGSTQSKHGKFTFSGGE
jgi:hypothetical protein